ncbi:MAG: ribosome biogenesis GTP-binding protein YihA/YsxC [Bacteroidota bacterium]
MDNKQVVANFIGSWPTADIMPQYDKPEFAFIGRSNVGKSSLINMLCSRKNLAHVSSNPGKTQTINLYTLGETCLLADLPGYGYARVSKEKRGDFDKMMRGYFEKRPNLYCAMVLIDARIPPQASDINFLNWLGSNGVPVSIVFTKADKKKSSGLEKQLQAIRDALLEHWEVLPREFITSANDQSGRTELLEFMLSAG